MQRAAITCRRESRASASAACASASSSVSVTTQCSVGSWRFSRSRYIVVSSVDEICRDAISEASVVDRLEREIVD